MKFDFDSPIVKRILSLLLAVLLFSFVNTENQGRFQSSSPTDGASITSSETISNLPIEVNIDTDKYFVSGIPDSATMRIEGPQAILFQTIATQNFTVSTPDLNTMGPGTHSVELIAEGLSNDLQASISPSVVNLTIEEKQVEEYDLSIEIDEEIDLADGYEIDEPSLSQNVVTISGASSTMKEIDEVIVRLSSDETEIKKDILSSAQVLVLDSEGELLNVNVSPQSVEILAPVIRTKKSLPIVLEEGKGKLPSYNYNLSLGEDEDTNLTVHGDPEVISELSNYPITVDFRELTETSLINVAVGELPEGIEEIDREEIEVLIEVEKKEKNNLESN
ncbi:MAG: hypothetical protein L0L39_02365 [Atopostipes suicloacalis]|nr:hypothetical protein [Atopostipes suicloacalis]MDN6731004.1 hypothetical protein [Atopostipes suicloacalis]